MEVVTCAVGAGGQLPIRLAGDVQGPVAPDQGGVAVPRAGPSSRVRSVCGVRVCVQRVQRVQRVRVSVCCVRAEHP
eukprot:551828-Rhodomonas_salina.1